MIKLAFIDKETRLVAYIASPANDQMYIDGDEYGKYIAKHIPVETEDSVALNTWHYTFEGLFAEHSPQLEHQIWDVNIFSYIFPANFVELLQEDGKNQVNDLSSQKILPKYPIYLQLNLPYDFGQDSVEVQTMRIWIDSVRTLANAAKAEIASATTLEEITTIVENFKTELGNIA